MVLLQLSVMSYKMDRSIGWKKLDSAKGKHSLYASLARAQNYFSKPIRTYCGHLHCIRCDAPFVEAGVVYTVNKRYRALTLIIHSNISMRPVVRNFM